MRWGTSGGYPVIVLAPGSVAECYNLTRRAFDLAERFRVPVFLATDKETVASSATVDLADYEDIPVRERALTSDNGTFTSFRFHPAGAVPPMAHYGGAHIVRFTASSHDERGYLTKNAATVGALNAHLAAKIDDHADEIALVAADIQPGADTLILSYGITARSACEAVQIARRDGHAVSLLTIYSLWPVPESAIRAALDGVRRVVVAELNSGLYRREIERLACGAVEVAGATRIDGELLSPHDILTQGGQL